MIHTTRSDMAFTSLASHPRRAGSHQDKPPVARRGYGLLAVLTVAIAGLLTSVSPASASPAAAHPTRTQAPGGVQLDPAAGKAGFAATSGWPIYNYYSGKCLDHSDGGTGLYAYVYTCNGRSNQAWYWSGNTLRDGYSGKCLDQSDGGTGLYAYVYTCNGRSNQDWFAYQRGPAWEIVNYSSGDCLDHSDGGTGLYAYVYPCNGRDNQLWYSPLL